MEFKFYRAVSIGERALKVMLKENKIWKVKDLMKKLNMTYEYNDGKMRINSNIYRHLRKLAEEGIIDYWFENGTSYACIIDEERARKYVESAKRVEIEWS